jgi:hypothetical protein
MTTLENKLEIKAEIESLLRTKFPEPEFTGWLVSESADRKWRARVKRGTAHGSEGLELVAEADSAVLLLMLIEPMPVYGPQPGDITWVPPDSIGDLPYSQVVRATSVEEEKPRYEGPPHCPPGKSGKPSRLVAELRDLLQSDIVKANFDEHLLYRLSWVVYHYPMVCHYLDSLKTANEE